MKELRGIDANPRLVAYLKDTEEILLFVSSNLVTYHTHKKVYSHLMTTRGEVVLLKTRFDRVNNREFIIWV